MTKSLEYWLCITGQKWTHIKEPLIVCYSEREGKIIMAIPKSNPYINNFLDYMGCMGNIYEIYPGKQGEVLARYFSEDYNPRPLTRLNHRAEFVRLKKQVDKDIDDYVAREIGTS